MKIPSSKLSIWSVTSVTLSLFFYMSHFKKLELTHSKNRRHSVLMWISYSIHSKYRYNKMSSTWKSIVTSFFPLFWQIVWPGKRGGVWVEGRHISRSGLFQSEKLHGSRFQTSLRQYPPAIWMISFRLWWKLIAASDFSFSYFLLLFFDVMYFIFVIFYFFAYLVL